ncbi:MAG TPA: inositol monophosphatase [Kofleriaceae bacterium]|nr:inositol monophosphatase [Kofleriaceae bacterium]
MEGVQDLIVDMLGQASEVARRHFGRAAGSVKPHDRSQVVTQADLEIAALLAGAIDARFPDHNRLDEELGAVDRGSRYTWVVDPIDGTSNFAVGVETYGVMIGLLEDDRPLAAGIALPAAGALYRAERGGGAWCRERRLRMDELDLSAALVAVGIIGDADDPPRTRRAFVELAELAMAARGLRCTNSVVDAVMVAEGRYGAWLVPAFRIWDSVAAHLLIEEAGGTCTRLDGGPLVYQRPLTRARDRFSVCAAPPLLHARLQEILAGPGGRGDVPGG